MQKICAHCGDEFEAKTTRAKYCSAVCRVNYHRQQTQAVETPLDTVFEALATISNSLYDKQLGHEAHTALDAIRQMCEFYAPPHKPIWWSCANCNINVRKPRPDNAECQCTTNGTQSAWFPLDTML